MQSYRVVIIFGAVIVGFLVFMLVSSRLTHNDSAVQLSANFISAFKANDAEKLKTILDPEQASVATDTENRVLSINFKPFHFGGAFSQMPEISHRYDELSKRLEEIANVTPEVYTTGEYKSVSYNQLVTFYFRTDSDGKMKLIYIGFIKTDSPNVRPL